MKGKKAPHEIISNDEAKSTIAAISRLLIKGGLSIDCVTDSLIDTAACLAYFHHNGDWKKFVATRLNDSIKTYEDIDREWRK